MSDVSDFPAPPQNDIAFAETQIEAQIETQIEDHTEAAADPLEFIANSTADVAFEQTQLDAQFLSQVETETEAIETSNIHARIQEQMRATGDNDGIPNNDDATTFHTDSTINYNGFLTPSDEDDINIESDDDNQFEIMVGKSKKAKDTISKRIKQQRATRYRWEGIFLEIKYILGPTKWKRMLWVVRAEHALSTKFDDDEIAEIITDYL